MSSSSMLRSSFQDLGDLHCDSSYNSLDDNCALQDGMIHNVHGNRSAVYVDANDTTNFYTRLTRWLFAWGSHTAGIT